MRASARKTRRVTAFAGPTAGLGSCTGTTGVGPYRPPSASPEPVVMSRGWVASTAALSTHRTSGGLVTCFGCPARHADFCQNRRSRRGGTTASPHLGQCRSIPRRRTDQVSWKERHLQWPPPSRGRIGESPLDPRPPSRARPDDVPSPAEGLTQEGQAMVHCRRCGTEHLVSAVRTLSTHTTSEGVVIYFRCPAGCADFYTTTR